MVTHMLYISIGVKRRKITLLSTTAALLLAAAPYKTFAASLTYYSPQNLLIGATPDLQKTANYGAGVTVGVIDTGGSKSWVGFQGFNGNSNQGKITSSICISACSNSALKSGNIDDNGHGTFVTGEIIGGFGYNNGNPITARSNGMLGIAPGANAVEVKVLDKNGSGYGSDVAKGIKAAVDQGAKVLNLSLGPSGSASGQAAFYSSLASSIDYAASKNAIVVFAGGNSHQALSAGANITGFSDRAIQHMLFVGSTNASKNLSSFSNTPGTAGFTSLTNTFYSYQSMWLMTDGENLTGASNFHSGTSYNYMTSGWSGTSMAAPQAVGAIALLDAKWPVLITNNGALPILLSTATDLGASGVDSTYGKGFINLALAFQPVGGLSVNTTGGKVDVTQLTGAMITGGALGTLSNISSLLSNYTAFDGYQRDFLVNLSNLITITPSTTPASDKISAPKTKSKSTKFADGSSLTFGSVEVDSYSVSDHPGSANAQPWYMSFSSATGEDMAIGYGVPASASFASALWGMDNEIAANSANEIGASNALMNLAQGGTFASYGDQFGKDTRVAFSFSDSRSLASSQNDSNFTDSSAVALSAGLTRKLTESWTAGFTFGVLDEQNSLLGSRYSEASPISLGDNHQSTSFGMSSDFKIGEKRNLVIDAAIVRTSGAQIADGIISDVSDLYARSFGAALVQEDNFSKGDSLSFSVRSPLQVVSGSASLAMTSVDGEGVATQNLQKVGLASGANQMDYSVGYSAFTDDGLNWNLRVDSRQNVNGVAGANDADILFGTKFSF